MKSSSKRSFPLLILFVSVLIFSMLAVSATTASTQQTAIITDDGIEIEAKYKKTSTNKITFNANGGKIGSKNTVAINIKKGAKINKFPTRPKRTGYKFMGWYNKKSGGKKVTVSTKPTESVTLFAQWTKKPNSSVLNAEEKKLVGSWVLSWDGSARYLFNKDGSYTLVMKLDYYDRGFHGSYSLKNGVLTTQYRYQTDYRNGFGFEPWSNVETSKTNIKLGIDNGKEYIVIRGLRYHKG